MNIQLHLPFMILILLIDCANMNTFQMTDDKKDKTLNKILRNKNIIGLDIYNQENLLLNTKFQITSSESPWNGLNQTWEEEEKGKTILAREFPFEDFKGLLSQKDLCWNEQAILYRSESRREVAIDSNYFSDLKRVNVTRMRKAEHYDLGAVKNSHIRQPNFLIPFLIKGQIIISFIHTDSELEIIEIIKTNDSTCYQFIGEHHYYTNRKNTSILNFQICLNESTGLISVMHP